MSLSSRVGVMLVGSVLCRWIGLGRRWLGEYLHVGIVHVQRGLLLCGFNVGVRADAF